MKSYIDHMATYQDKQKATARYPPQPDMCQLCSCHAPIIFRNSIEHKVRNSEHERAHVSNEGASPLGATALIRLVDFLAALNEEFC